MEERERVPALKEMARVAEHLILVDYAAPIPHRFARVLVSGIERLGGWGNFEKFRSYQHSGGLPALTAAAGLNSREIIPLFHNAVLLVEA